MALIFSDDGCLDTIAWIENKSNMRFKYFVLFATDNQILIAMITRLASLCTVEPEQRV